MGFCSTPGLRRPIFRPDAKGQKGRKFADFSRSQPASSTEKPVFDNAAKLIELACVIRLRQIRA
jgi:hypothetical protein